MLSTMKRLFDDWNDGNIPLPVVESKLISSKKKGKLLDLGCGSGRGMKRFQSYGGWQTFGIDLYFQKDASKYGDCAKASGQDLPFREKTFDVIYLSQVLHHVPSPSKLLREVYRCLKENGYLLVIENIEDNALLRISRELYPSHDGMQEISDFSRLKKSDVQTLLAKTGFRIEAESSGVVVWVLWYELARRISYLQVLAIPVSLFDKALEKALPNNHAQYYGLLKQRV
jgi:SAM-dependent methyltransferase